MGPPAGAAARGVSKSPKQPGKTSPPKQSRTSAAVDAKRDAPTKEETPNAEIAKPLAPPPRPNPQQSQGQQPQPQPQPSQSSQQRQGTNSPDYFGNPPAPSLSLEPNPFEQSFGGAPPETPGGTKLPSVAALTSPSSLLPGNTPFAWGGGSLRTGPLSPAMLSGPANDYFSDTHHIRSFPTPNESSLRTGLTPGGSGSMFPAAPSPNSALFSQLTNGPAATPSTLDFHRTALNAAANAKREQNGQAQPQPPQQQQQQQQPQQQPQAQPSVQPTSQPQEMANGTQIAKAKGKAPTAPVDSHDSDAANGLYLLAQGGNGAQPAAAPQQQYPPVPPVQVQAGHPATTAPLVQPMMASLQTNNATSLTSAARRGVSEPSGVSDESDGGARPNTRTRGKRATGGAAAGARRKAEELHPKAPANKKSKTNGSISSMEDHSDDDDDHDRSGKEDNGGSKSKMTDEEKRKNFLERNRVAALKCRQRKKQWLASLQSKVEMFSTENESLSAQVNQLREEVVNLKTLLLAHKDCPITQQQGLHSAFMQQQPMEAFQPAMGYAMPAPMAGQAVMAGQAMNRRFS